MISYVNRYYCQQIKSLELTVDKIVELAKSYQTTHKNVWEASEKLDDKFYSAENKFSLDGSKPPTLGKLFVIVNDCQ